MTAVESLLPSLMDLVWTYNQMDIATTLQGVCWKVLADAGGNVTLKKERARGLRQLGKTFLKAAAVSSQQETIEKEGQVCYSKEEDDTTCGSSTTEMVVLLILMRRKKTNSKMIVIIMIESKWHLKWQPALVARYVKKWKDCRSVVCFY
jgi:hypothetical protein